MAERFSLDMFCEEKKCSMFYLRKGIDKNSPDYQESIEICRRSCHYTAREYSDWLEQNRVTLLQFPKRGRSE